MTVPVYPGMAPFARDYDAVILDLWGVVHDGARLYPGALDCLERLQGAGKRVVVVSNAPRRALAVVETLRGLGIPERLFERVITSGDATRLALARRTHPWYAALGRAYLHLGPERDARLLEGLDYRMVGAVEEAEFVLATGVVDREDELERYEPLLAAGVGRGLAMVCANPDRAVVRSGRRELCAGALAERYAELGGEVSYEGKPYPLIYELCFEALEGVKRRRVLAVGDGLKTDIAGAVGVGIDSVLVTGGLLADAWGVARSSPPDAELLAAACAAAGAEPSAAILAFVW